MYATVRQTTRKWRLFPKGSQPEPVSREFQGVRHGVVSKRVTAFNLPCFGRLPRADECLPDRQVSRSPYQGVTFYEDSEPQFSLSVVRAPGSSESGDGVSFLAGNDISFQVKYNCARWLKTEMLLRAVRVNHWHVPIFLLPYPHQLVLCVQHGADHLRACNRWREHGRVRRACQRLRRLQRFPHW